MSRRPPVEVEGRKTASAGQAIIVVLLALLIAAFVNADSLVESIEGQSFGTSRSVGLALAKPVRTISHWTGLDLPRKLIDDIVNGRGHPKPVAVAPPPQPRPSPTVSATTTTVPPRRVPTAQQPLKVWLAGDSLMGNISQSFIEKTSGDPLVSATQNFQIGTGLARPDVYNWPAEIANEMATVNPDVVIFIFGANDDQDMETNGHRFVLQSADWQQEYARRVNQVMDETANGVRQVIWLGVPAVRRPRLNQTKDYINNIVKAAAATHKNVTYFDIGSLLDGPNNSFETYRTNTSGQSVAVRDADGIHLTLAGAGLVTPVLESDLDEFWHLSQ
jgi:uncharacterized protein